MKLTWKRKEGRYQNGEALFLGAWRVETLAGLCRIEIKRWSAASESNPNMSYMVELMEIALAALAAEPVAYADIVAFKNFSSGTASKEWMWAKPDTGLAPLFTLTQEE